LGLSDLPSDRVMDDIDKYLQKMCGVNDLAAIIAQEMSNPTVREHLHFLPEDTKPSLSQAWQAGRWLDELDSDLTTPMIRIHAFGLQKGGCAPRRKSGGWTLLSPKSFLQGKLVSEWNNRSRIKSEFTEWLGRMACPA
ncbi:hypothetical protein B0H10DRAFT_2085071, partial [Mycena sp. CBHHK59/15]